MLKIYTAYKCKGCGRTFILLTSEMIAAIGQGKYIACPICGNQNIKVTKASDNLRECMEERSYYRAKGGAWRQR